MRIVEMYSHLNGREHIVVHYPELWNELQSIIEDIDADSCRTKVSKEKKMVGKLLYSPAELNKAFALRLEAKGWAESRTHYYVTANAELARETLLLPPEEQQSLIVQNGSEAIYSYNQTDFVKGKVAIEVQFGKYAFVAYDLFVKHMAFYIANTINVGIEVLPMKELQKEMSSGIAYYEGELYNVIRQGRNTPAVPLVLVGIAP